MASIGSNSAFDGMQPRLTHSDAISALSPMKKSTRAPSLAAVWAAVKPAEPPPDGYRSLFAHFRDRLR